MNAVGIAEGHALGYFKGHMRAPYASAELALYIDGVEVHRSPTLTTQGEPWPIVVRIEDGSQLLRLVVTTFGYGYAHDYVDLVETGFVFKGSNEARALVIAAEARAAGYWQNGMCDIHLPQSTDL